MYGNKLKVGDIIVVSGFRPCVGASTAAAMIAATLACKGEKTLLLTTDPGQPYDAASMLSDDIIDSHLDDMILLENSNGLNEGNIQDYVTQVTENLSYCRPSGKITRMAKDPEMSLNHIMDIACYQYRFVVLDLGYSMTIDPMRIYNKANLVVNVLGQDPKSVNYAKEYYKQDNFGKDKFVVPVIADFHEDLPVDDGYYEKALKFDCVFAMNHDAAMYAACQKRDIATFVQKGMKQRAAAVKSGGGIGRFKKSKEPDVPVQDEVTGGNPTVNGYSMVCDKIMGALVHVDEGGET